MSHVVACLRLVDRQRADALRRLPTPMTAISCIVCVSIADTELCAALET